MDFERWLKSKWKILNKKEFNIANQTFEQSFKSLIFKVKHCFLFSPIIQQHPDSAHQSLGTTHSHIQALYSFVLNKDPVKQLYFLIYCTVPNPYINWLDCRNIEFPTGHISTSQVADPASYPPSPIPFSVKANTAIQRDP